MADFFQGEPKLNRRPQTLGFNWHGFKDMLGYFQIKPLRVSKQQIALFLTSGHVGICIGAAQ
ncbi:hypothetical protein [Catenovulum sediminis]|uniref:Transposase n=1 Tax=Catenovulum sediminis TaxID=1740262 RepID=A0ABV1RFA4_9ALTE